MCVAEDITHVGHCQEHTRHHVADALALGAFGVRWAAANAPWHTTRS